MTAVSLVFFSFLPFLIWFFHCLTRKRAGIIHLVFFTFAAFFAVALSIAARFALEPFSMFFPSAAAPYFASLVVTALPEEVAKLLAVLPFCRSGPERSVLPVKVILARAVCVALAFASFENIFFAFSVPGSLPLRFITAVPLHASLSVFSACGLVRLQNRDGDSAGSRSGRAPGFFMLMAAIFLHSFYALGFELRAPLIALSALMASGAFIVAVVLWNTCGDDDE